MPLLLRDVLHQHGDVLHALEELGRQGIQSICDQAAKVGGGHSLRLTLRGLNGLGAATRSTTTIIIS